MANFLEKVTQKIKGDDAAVKAAKILRKAESAIKGQVATLNAKLVDDENNLETAQEALDNCIFTGADISSNQIYCNNIASAELNVRQYQENLDATKKSITYFQGLLSNFAS